MRDLVMFFAMIAMVPMAIMNGFVAFLFWGYTTVLTPAHYLYGFMQSVRFNFIFAIIALSLLLLRREKNNAYKPNITVTYWLLVAFLVHANICAALALSPNPLVSDTYEKIMKGFAFVLAIPFFVKDRTGIHVVLIMIALGLGLHGVVEGLKFVVAGGAHRMSGIPGSSLTDNNLFAVAMVMILPIILYFYNVLNNTNAKYISLIAFLLTILTVIATNSRGGFLALAVLGVWYFLTSRRKGFAFIAVLVGFGLVMAVAPDTWFDRISSIETANEDNSFMNRVAAWQVSFAIGIGNPIFGGGFSAIQNYWIWDTYKVMTNIFGVDVDLYSPKAAHSIYFQVLGDMGVVGLLLFLLLLTTAIINRNAINKKIKITKRQDLVWAIDMADAMFLSLLAYMVGGAGVSLPYYEIVYMLICLLSILNSIIEKQVQRESGKASLD
jgi:probable O-glycosylation ligase (exosortase A-associated)